MHLGGCRTAPRPGGWPEPKAVRAVPEVAEAEELVPLEEADAEENTGKVKAVVPESEDDIEKGNQRKGDYEQRNSAHGTWTRPRERLLQPPFVQVNGHWQSNAHCLHQQ